MRMIRLFVIPRFTRMILFLLKAKVIRYLSYLPEQ
jgi:hypothetical protein